MSEETKLVPQYRFPEFKDDEDWRIGKLIKYADFVTEKSHLEDLSLHTYISTENILPNYGGVTISSKLPPSGTFTNYKRGDVLISNIRPYLKKVWFADRDGACSNDVLVLRAKPTLFEQFLSIALKNDAFITFVMAGAKGLKMPRGDKDLIAGYLLSVPPSKPEQQKIAACLSSLDNTIAAETQKLEALKEHRKSLLQNILPKEGQTKPKRRFKKFEKDDDWIIYKIGEIANVSAGGTPKSNNSAYWNGKIPWMNSGDLNNKRIFSVSNFITEKGLKESSTKLIPPKCILIGLAGQGKTRGTAAINYIELCTNQSIGAIHPNPKVFDSEFLFQVIDSLYDRLRKLSAGDGGRGGLNLQIIKDVEIPIPKVKEQQKISNLLISVDMILNAQTKKIDQLVLFKKALLQGLFPTEIV